MWIAAGAALSVLALGGCGSDENTPTDVTGAGNAVQCVTGTFNGAGSRGQKPAVVAWTAAYQQACADVAFNYDAQGSNNGRTQFIQKQVPLAGSDAFLVDPQRSQAQQRCAPGAAVDLPMVITPIAIVYNVPEAKELTLTPALVAKIFDGKVTRWNDAGRSTSCRTTDTAVRPTAPTSRCVSIGSLRTSVTAPSMWSAG